MALSHILSHEILLRVRKNLNKSLPLVDPDPGKCYTCAKTAKYVLCHTEDEGNTSVVQQPDPEEEDPRQEGNWITETKDLTEQFSYMSIVKHARKSGRNSASYVEKPLEKVISFSMKITIMICFAL